MSATVLTRFTWTDDSGAGLDGTILNNAQLQAIFDAIDAAIAPVVQTKAGAYTAVVTDDVIKATSGTWTLGLFTAVGNDGKFLTLSNVGTGVVTIDPNGAQTIGGKSTWPIGPKTVMLIYSDGANWQIASLASTTEAARQLFIPAGAIRPLTTGGCGFIEDATSTNTIAGLPFDPATSEGAFVWFEMPKSWNRDTLTAKFVTFNKAGGAGNFVFSLAALACSDNDSISSALGTAQQVTDGALTAYNIQIGAATAAITSAGSPAENDIVLFVVKRLPLDAADTYGSDVYLAGFQLTLTTNAPADD